MKYKFTGGTKEYFGRTLHQIVCVTAFGSVSVGDVGGWIEKEENLSQTGIAWVYPQASVMGSAKIFGGVFRGGVFRGGEFRGGVFRTGVFYDGVFYGGEFHGGVFRGGLFNGGVFYDGVFRGGEFHGGVFSGGEFYDGVFRDGWLILQVQGSAHFVNSPDGVAIRIGCQEFTPEYWSENFESIGRKHGYTDGQIAEYKRYIDLFMVVMNENR